MLRRNPFQGGMGFFTRPEDSGNGRWKTWSQSLSGWDGVFHYIGYRRSLSKLIRSQSLSGWDGVFHLLEQANNGAFLRSQSLSGWDGVFHRHHRKHRQGQRLALVAIPFRVGWGFSLD